MLTKLTLLLTLLLTPLLTPVALAATWTGHLIDALCHDQPQKTTNTCEITPSTTSFALQAGDGSVLHLDAAGNAKAAGLVLSDIAKFKNAQFRVEGDLDGNVIRVRTLDPVNTGKGID